MLRVGSKGQAVVQWQTFLKEMGYFSAGVAPIFGPKTHDATIRFQRDQGLQGDGIVGPKTREVANRASKPPNQLSDAQIAKRAGIPTRVLRAIRHVESRGKPSAVRFEPHLFFRHRPDLRNQVPYTPSERGYSTVRSETNRQALEHAMTLDADSAIRSTSFGSYQVLGGHLLTAYGNDPHVAYNSFRQRPREASDLMVAAWFQDNKRARKYANTKPVPDFKNLARTYNGPNYHVHKYDEQLKVAWEKQ